MKKTINNISTVLALAPIITFMGYIIYVRFTDMTGTRLLITFWREYFLALSVAVLFGWIEWITRDDE